MEFSSVLEPGVVDSPAPEKDLSPHLSLVERIGTFAQLLPNHVALVDGDATWTYSQLNRRTNQLANLLVQRGVGTDVAVGLLLDRSADFVLAALAVLKAGGAYVPMDAATPADRVAFTLRDAGAVVLITHRNKSANVPAGEWQVIDLDASKTEIAATSDAAIDADYADTNLAYVVYTSGSTGRPKGVEITHANVLNLIHWHNTSFGVTSSDHATQIGGLGFDVTAWELWPHLTAGATLHIAPESARRAPTELRDWMVQHKITVSFTPTVLAEQLLQLSWPAETSLRYLLTGGDVLSRRPAVGLPFELVNNYGPAECTVVSTFGTVRTETDDAARLPSIGRAIPNATILLLDESLRAVAAGEVGELCIAGKLVGRGYRNNAELTAERFANYTAPGGETMRIYRTGDQARFLANGEIAFVGRIDEQVKIRGYRIELGEINAWLSQHPAVAACAASVRKREDVPELVAYLVLKNNAAPSATELSEFIAAHVPSYMVPARYVRIASLPVTTNGKLDHAALPVPSEQNSLETKIAATAPAAVAGDVESRINTMVAGLLGLPAVKRDDNFFLLGGHSMLGVQLVAKLRDAFGVKLPLRKLFSAPTVAALSAEVGKMTAGGN